MIHVSHVSRSYGPLKAVDDVSLEVNAGEIVGLLGPNGAGKTTLLRMLATLIKPDAGTIEIDGFDTKTNPLDVRQRLGYQTGDTGLYARLTPKEFLEYFATLHGIPKAVSRERIDRLIENFGIAEFAMRPCGGLSTGQKQRVVLARTLIHDPPVLVLDEPTSGLDVISSQFILTSVRTLAEQGRAVLFSTHILSEVELLCDRAVVMHRGREIANGSAEELCAQTGESGLARAFLALVRNADGEAA